AAPPRRDESALERGARFAADPFRPRGPAILQRRDPETVDPLVRITDRYSGARRPGLNQRRGARTRRALMGARLKGHISGRAPRRLACPPQRLRLGMRTAAGLYRAAPDNLAIFHDDATYRRNTRNTAKPARGDIERPL